MENKEIEKKCIMFAQWVINLNHDKNPECYNAVVYGNDIFDVDFYIELKPLEELYKIYRDGK